MISFLMYVYEDPKPLKGLKTLILINKWNNGNDILLH